MADGVQMQQRHDTAANWHTSNYFLAVGEIGIAIDTGVIKFGDGVNQWDDLPIALQGQFLPLGGKAADSELLDGIDSTNFVKQSDTDTAATASKVIKRLSDGRAKVAVATASDDAVAKSQLDTVSTAVASNTSAISANTSSISTNTSDITSLKVASVANRTALLALSTGSLRYGYVVRQTDKGYLWMWDLSGWRYMGNPGGDNPWIRVTRGSLAWGNTNGQVYGYSLGSNSDTELFTWTTGTSITAGGSVTVTDKGRYKIISTSQVDYGGGAYYSNVQNLFPSLATGLLSVANTIAGSGVPSGFQDFSVTDQGELPAGQVVKQNVYINTAGSTLRASQLVVERVPSI